MRFSARSSAAVAVAVATIVPAATAYAAPSPQLPQASPQTPQGQDSPQTPSAPSVVSPGSPGLAPPPPGPVGPAIDDGTEVPMVAPSVYTPIPSKPLHAPKPTPDVPRKQWKADTLTLGNVEVPLKDLPKELRDNPRAIVSLNDWAAYGESQIARFLISIGVPKDEATRQAAAAIIGGVVGGAAGGAIAFTATAVAVGTVVIPVTTVTGLAIGSALSAVVPPQPFAGPLWGTGIGAGVGVGITLAAAAAAGVAAGIAGATVGAALTWALGTGDPATNYAPPSPDQYDQIVPNPGGNQFELHMPAPSAQAAGLPGVGVDYVVTSRGDVEIAGQVAGQQFNGGWSAEQAQAPIDALGPLAPVAEKAISDGVRSLAGQAKSVLPQLEVAWPQLDAPTKAGKHRR
ncbi:hypothetical protein FOV72_19685 [Gordonia rubripertincta]|uniref:hypothetical protein n=1 Tax=Gordonia rubripertincta TaxID=36822 RepID=UPI00117DFE04|nr:hypothetical protein [Gordonia rubripertincta]TSD93484.1 hypothetical protein FOV72_19685 [Gordonia rubripertincta]